MTAWTTPLVIGGRTFQVGKLPLGPIRQNPEAFKPLTGIGKGKEFDLVTTALVVFSSIDQGQTPVKQDEFYALIDAIPFDQGMDELTAAFVVAMQGQEAKDGAARSGEATAETGSLVPPVSALSTG